MEIKTKIQIKAGGSIVETMLSPNSNSPIEVAHSSFKEVVERLSNDIKQDIINELQILASDKNNYNQNFLIEINSVLNKQ